MCDDEFLLKTDTSQLNNQISWENFGRPVGIWISCPTGLFPLKSQPSQKPALPEIKKNNLSPYFKASAGCRLVDKSG